MRKIIKQSLIFAKYFLKYKKRIKHRYVQVWIRLEGIHIESIVSPSHWWRVTTRETRAFNGERVTGITSLRLILNLVRHSEDFFVYLARHSTDRTRTRCLFLLQVPIRPPAPAARNLRVNNWNLSEIVNQSVLRVSDIKALKQGDYSIRPYQTSKVSTSRMLPQPWPFTSQQYENLVCVELLSPSLLSLRLLLPRLSLL